MRHDRERVLLKHLPAASGGSHVLLGHALEQAAETGEHVHKRSDANSSRELTAVRYLTVTALSGDINLATAVLDHMYDERVDPAPQRSRAEMSDVRRSKDSYVSGLRAHHWCWPSILRAKHLAEKHGTCSGACGMHCHSLDQSVLVIYLYCGSNGIGHTDIATLLTVACHDDRPSNPTTPRLSEAHSHHSSHVSRSVHNHSLHRDQQRY